MVLYIWRVQKFKTSMSITAKQRKPSKIQQQKKKKQTIEVVFVLRSSELSQSHSHTVF